MSSFQLFLSLHRKGRLQLRVFGLAALDPLLEQVFVVAVGPGAQREHSLVGELAAVGVDEHGDEAVMFAWQTVDQLHDRVDDVLTRSEKKEGSW